MTDGTTIPIQQIPLQRIGKAREVAELANFLTEARYITGQVIPSADIYVTNNGKRNKTEFDNRHLVQRISCILKI